jgi:hypothetical protein
MVQVLERKPSFGEQMARGGGQALGSALTGGVEGYMQKKENEALKEQLGIDLAGINDPDMRKQIIGNMLKGQSPDERKQIAAAQEGLETVKRQKERLASGHLGPKIAIAPGTTGRNWGSTFSKEGKKVRAAYEQAGKELIQLASTLPIRNKEEFKTLGHKLYDPELDQKEIEGILEEMEKHIQDAYDSLVPKRTAMKNNKNQISKGKEMKPETQELDLNQFFKK